ncbi:MAG: BLUF domain-containing protein [Gammaproteobacteria bacterium]|nr:MAG: BLUF domain-containing protein [Gammaproteobacteria bacterium]
MPLVRLIYGSSVTEKFTGDEIRNLLVESRKNNAKKNITGILWFNRNYVMQALEGDAADVNALYLKISTDARHKSLMLLDYRPINKREFSRWSMGLVPEIKRIKEILIIYTAKGEFNPYTLVGDIATDFLISLREEVVSE